MTPQQAQDFINTLLQGTTLMDTMYQLSGISNEWDQNVFQAISNISVSPNTPSAKTLGDYLFNPSIPMAVKVKILCDLNPAPGSPNGTTPNQGYQQIVSILQQGGFIHHRPIENNIDAVADKHGHIESVD